jgi:hypothetical protein
MAGPANTDAGDAEYSTQVCDVGAEILSNIMYSCVYIDNEGEWQWFQRMEDWQMNRPLCTSWHPSGARAACSVMPGAWLPSGRMVMDPIDLPESDWEDDSWL